MDLKMNKDTMLLFFAQLAINQMYGLPSSQGYTEGWLIIFIIIFAAIWIAMTFIQPIIMSKGISPVHLICAGLILYGAGIMISIIV